MDLTPQLLETQQFPEKFRGYDCDAVDDFLERVGGAVGDLLSRLDRANNRIAELEQAAGTAQIPAVGTPAAPVAAAPAPSTQSDAEQISRALLLAQKVADDALAAARAEGAEAIAQASAQAETIVSEAHTQAAEIRTAAATEGQTAARERQAEADRLLVDAKRLRDETAQAAARDAEEALAAARSEAAALVEAARTSATADLERRQAELTAELAELEAAVFARRAEARRLTDLVGGRRDAIASLAQELGAVSARLVQMDAEAEQPEPGPGREVIDLSASESSAPLPAAPTPSHPAGTDVGGGRPRWATIDGSGERDETEAAARADLHLVDEPQLQPEVSAPAAPSAPEVPVSTGNEAAAVPPMPQPPEVAGAPTHGSTVVAVADIDDPFLAALRSHEPLRGDEVDAESPRRRRRGS